MATFTATVDTPRSPDEAFAYVADFTNTAAWDPGIEHAERLDRGEVGAGSRFRLITRVLGRAVTLEYEIVDHAPPHRVVLLGGNATTRSLDTITFVPLADGTRITYDADLSLRGLLKPLQPLLWWGFPPVARRAVAGLRDALDGEVVRSD